MLSTDSSGTKSLSQPTKKFLTETDIFHSVRSAVIASRLVRKEHYAPALAMAVVGEYLRFLLLKALKEDWNDDILFPSPQVNLAWQQHLLSTGSYVDECISICGRILHHNPDGDLDNLKTSTRYARTLVEYERVFGSAPRESIWPRFIADPEASGTSSTSSAACSLPSPSSTSFASSGSFSSAAAASSLATSTFSLRSPSGSRRSSYSEHADTNSNSPIVKKERIDNDPKVKMEKTGKDEKYLPSSRDEAARKTRGCEKDRNYVDDNGNTKLSPSSSSSVRGIKRRATSPDHHSSNGRSHTKDRPSASPDRNFDVRILSSPSTFELSLNVNTSTRIGAVLQEYATRRRISHSDIRLMYYRDALDESKTVGECGLRKGSVLRAVFASKGD